MSTVNQANLLLLAKNGLAIMTDYRVGGPASTQSTATPLLSMLTRVTNSVASGSFILPSIGTGVARGHMFLVNDSGGAVVVYPATGENQNGSSNGSLSVANGATAVFCPIFPEVATTADWRSAAIT